MQASECTAAAPVRACTQGNAGTQACPGLVALQLSLTKTRLAPGVKQQQRAAAAAAPQQSTHLLKLGLEPGCALLLLLGAGHVQLLVLGCDVLLIGQVLHSLFGGLGVLKVDKRKALAGRCRVLIVLLKGPGQSRERASSEQRLCCACLGEGTWRRWSSRSLQQRGPRSIKATAPCISWS